MTNELHELLMKLTKPVLIELMDASLDQMQSYNGMSKTRAICLAMGCKEVEHEGGTSYQPPSLKEIKESFS